MKKPLKTPLLPHSRALVALSCENTEIINALQKLKIEVFPVMPNRKLEKPIASHADCNLLQADEKTFFCEKTLLPSLTDLLGKNIIEAELFNNSYIDTPKEKERIVNYLTKGERSKNSQKTVIVSADISSPYPNDVRINVKVTHSGIFCNTKHINSGLKFYSELNSIALNHCNQGYVGCSSVLVDNNAIITDDESVYNSFYRMGFDCLMLSKGQIKLSGHSYGFIGGACGFVDKRLLAFTGRLDSHRDAERIKNFLNKYNTEYIELTENCLTDIGGIVPILEEYND